ncbi:MAG: hypothetical protein EOO02_21450 [Chitinophagaceae bacterium]|nr:MAG: hypothetical protein EOO02_21450 [Chitinophagaceae bacterium]
MGQDNTGNAGVTETLEAYRTNKQIPAIIERSVLIALSHYPQLKNTKISFVFRKNIKGSVMQAQPVFTSLLKKRRHRSYRINISAMFKLTHSVTPIHQLPPEIMIGWIGHELGHIMDYESRSNKGMISFGYNYLLSGTYVKSVEVVADTYAVNHGLGEYIIATKRFILDHAELPEAYKAKIARLYLSPDDIVEQVRKLEEKRIEEQKQSLIATPAHIRENP